MYQIISEEMLAMFASAVEFDKKMRMHIGNHHGKADPGAP